jgi:hypothetical protein
MVRLGLENEAWARMLVAALRGRDVDVEEFHVYCIRRAGANARPDQNCNAACEVNVFLEDASADEERAVLAALRLVLRSRDITLRAINVEASP